VNTNKKIKRINSLIERLYADSDVSRTSLKRVLTAKQFTELDKDWATEKASRKFQKPGLIMTYESKLRRGLLLYGKYEATHHKLAAYDSRRLIESAESALGKALEFAQEMVQNTNSLQEWLDRDPNDCDGFTPASMPRVVTSKSADNQSSLKKAPCTYSKKQLKLIALQNALEELQPNDLELLSQEIKASKVATRRKLVMEFEGFKF